MHGVSSINSKASSNCRMFQRLKMTRRLVGTLCSKRSVHKKLFTRTGNSAAKHRLLGGGGKEHPVTQPLSLLGALPQCVHRSAFHEVSKLRHSDRPYRPWIEGQDCGRNACPQRHSGRLAKLLKFLTPHASRRPLCPSYLVSKPTILPRLNNVAEARFYFDFIFWHGSCSLPEGS